jgi:hypothetical protein
MLKSAWMVAGDAKTIFSLSGYGGPSNISTFTCTLLIAAWSCGKALPNGSVAIITTGVILPLTKKPRMRFITVYPIRSLRLPDFWIIFKFWL